MVIAQRPVRPLVGGRDSGAETTPQSRLLRGYLHKTSNSLCGIKGYASLIAEEDYLENPSVKWAWKIIREVEKMEDIFRSVGDLSESRPDSGRQHTLSSVLQDVMTRSSRDHDTLRISCGFVPTGQLLLPAADLTLALREIITNSVESVENADRQVAVGIDCTASCEGRISVRIHDDGPGIAPGLAAQVMDPFLTTKQGHLGIGLTRVDTLMDMHGLAWAMTSTENQGTVVTLEAAAAMDAVELNV